MPTKKRTKDKPKKRPPKLDPVLPLPAGTEIPPVRPGEGKDILNSTAPLKIVELPYRAFYSVWELVERRAAEQYPKHVGGAFNNHAQAWLEAAAAFRSAFSGTIIEPMDEARAQKARRILARIEAEEAAAAKRKGSRKSSEAPESPVEAPEPASGTKDRPRKRNRPQRGGKTVEKKRQKKAGKRKTA